LVGIICAALKNGLILDPLYPVEGIIYYFAGKLVQIIQLAPNGNEHKNKFVFLQNNFGKCLIEKFS
jgi:hypothetical protein